MVANVMFKKLSAGSAETNLYSALGIEEEVGPLDYTDLPAFEQKANTAYQTIVVRVRNQEDLKKFAELIGQPKLLLPNKTSGKSTWYPELKTGERGQNALYAWMDENDPEVQRLLQEEEDE